MRKFLLKSILLTSIVLVICLGMRLFIGPFWGHSTASQKWEVYHIKHSDANTLFIGSSRIYKHIMPKVFDSLAKIDGYSTNSFNLGVNSFPAPQSLRMLDLLIEETGSVKYYFVELTPIYDEINDKIINTPEWNYWYDGHHLTLLARHVWSRPDLGYQNKIKRIKEHLQSYLGNFFLIGSAQFYLEENLKDEKWLVEQFDQQKGFVSFESAMKNQAEKSDDLTGRFEKFQNDTTVLDIRKKEALKLKKWKKNNDLNSPYVEELKNLMKKVEDKGGKLFLIIPPRMENYSGYRFFADIYKMDNLIDLSDPESYPEFYQAKNSFDVGHLNLKGARIFTNRLYQLIQDKNGFVK